MRTFLLTLTSLFGFVLSNSLHGLPSPKFKIVDAFHTIDPKTVRHAELKVKVASTGDNAHPKALEIIADFANPMNGGYLVKSFPAGLVNPKRYSGMRMWVRSETETGFGVGFAGDKPRADGSPMAYGSFVKATPEWTEVIIPFSQCVKSGVTVWKDGAQKVFPGGAPIPDEDYPLFTSIGFSFPIEHRGNSTFAKVQVEGLALVEK